MNNFYYVTDVLVIAMSLLSFIYTAGVVWRVEKELDLSYKLFLLSVACFIVWQVLGFFPENGVLPWKVILNVFKILFALSFLGGIIAMRDLVRKMDGEKPDMDMFKK